MDIPRNGNVHWYIGTVFQDILLLTLQEHLSILGN